MSAPLGNTFERLRKNKGMPRKFTREEFIELAISYFESVDNDRSWDKIDFKGKDVDEVTYPVKAPYTLCGLCVYLGVSETYLNNLSDKLQKDNEEDQAFRVVIQEIKAIVKNNQVTGAMTGHYNSNLTARLNSISENVKEEVKTSGEIKVDFSKLSKEELIDLQKLREKLEK